MAELYDHIEELMLELEDEDSDPVGGRTIAIVPGAFKPPHLGHIDMVRQYAEMADEVVVLISSPLKASRKVGDKILSPTDAKAIWELLLADTGLSNVRIELSPLPSPIAATYEYIGDEGPLVPGTKVILGASRKGNDLRRWTGAQKYVKSDIELIPPDETAVNPANKADGAPFNATDARKMLEKGENADEFFGMGLTDEVRSILGLDEPIEEMSGVGAVAGYSLPLGAKRINKKKKKEYNELELYKEVMKLFTEKGVIK